MNWSSSPELFDRQMATVRSLELKFSEIKLTDSKVSKAWQWIFHWKHLPV
jgi:hypothetical protein